MKVGIIGAGFAGIATAKVLRQYGHDVAVYDKAPDVGGVWSRTRRYPGLRTQNNKGTYALSDLPMPSAYPEWPSGEQVQSYLESYVDKFGLRDVLHLDTEVTLAEPNSGGGWALTTAAGKTNVDHLVIASGIFSQPFVPEIDGADAFTAAGGCVLPSSELHSLDQVRGKNVVVIGYGKSACDIAVEIADVAASTAVVARELLWKMPRKISGVLNYKYLMLTRMGEALFRYRSVRGVEKVLHAGNSRIARSMLGSVEKVTTKQLGLPGLSLVPQGTFADIARSTVSLATEGFFEAVQRGTLAVHRDAEVKRLSVDGDRRQCELSDGTVLSADVVVAATGWTQDLPYLPDEVNAKLLNDEGDFLLYRQIHPINVPDLSFAGFNSSFFSPLSAEMSAVWIGSLLGGGHTLPPVEQMLASTEDRLTWMRERTRGKHARGTNIIPFSMHNIDEVLSDLDVDVSAATRAVQWLMPIDPSKYRHVSTRVGERLARG